MAKLIPKNATSNFPWAWWKSVSRLVRKKPNHYGLKESFLYAKENPLQKTPVFSASAQGGRQMPGEMKVPRGRRSCFPAVQPRAQTQHAEAHLPL